MDHDKFLYSRSYSGSRADYDDQHAREVVVCFVGEDGWLVGWLVGWLIGRLVGDVFVLSWLSSATTIEEGTRKEPNINQQSNLLLVRSRSTAEQAQRLMNWHLFQCHFFVFPEQVTQNRSD